MTVGMINGIWYQVLEDLVHESNNGNLYKDTIVVDNNGDVVLLRSVGFGFNPQWSIQGVKDEIDKIANSTKWRNEERRIKSLQYYRNVLNIMIGYKRSQTIDSVLDNDYNNYDTLCLAC